jgi:lysophospholipase L1-like esterase
MKLRLSIVALLCGVVAAPAAALTPVARADDSPTTYYLSLGDSLAAGTNATGVGVAYTDMGYADQLYSALAADESKLKLVKLGCPGESTVSMRFGSQYPTVVLSCGYPRDYKDLYPKGTQIAEAVSFLQAHKGKVALVTIDIGANDLQRFDAQGNVVICLLEAAGCATQTARMVRNLTAILADLRAAAGPDVPIVGMSYYDVFAPLCVSDPSLLFVCSRVDAFNATLVDTYAAAGDPVADVAGAFENGNLLNAAAHVCAWTWFCTYGDLHPNTIGYGVIAQAFEQAVP